MFELHCIYIMLSTVTSIYSLAYLFIYQPIRISFNPSIHVHSLYRFQHIRLMVHRRLQIVSMEIKINMKLWQIHPKLSLKYRRAVVMMIMMMLCIRLSMIMHRSDDDDLRIAKYHIIIYNFVATTTSLL